MTLSEVNCLHVVLSSKLCCYGVVGSVDERPSGRAALTEVLVRLARYPAAVSSTSTNT
jgi:hypothetical protein